MSSWIETLKTYHTENKSKYRIPKKDSEEYQTILKYHQTRIGGSGTTKVVKNEVVTPEVTPAKLAGSVKVKRAYKKKPKDLNIPVKKTNDGNNPDEDCFSD